MYQVESLEDKLSEMLGPEPWCIDDIGFENGVFEISGWALAPGGRHSDVTFTLNGKEFDSITFPSPRPDIAEIFWYKPGSYKAAFQCQAFVTREEVFQDGYATLQCARKESLQPLREEFSYYYPDDRDEPPMPDVDKRKRVSGGERAEPFRLEGFTTFMKLDRILRQSEQKGLEDFRSLLDWGCGCGRVTRYLQRLPDTKIVGIDIDANNVEWCRSNLPAGEYRHAPLHPPADLELSAFDLIIGISVFSHLNERDHIEWLYELHRVAKPGAILLMSTLGDASVSRARYTPSAIREWQKKGFIVHGNQDLAGYIEDEHYYVNACITKDYIRQQWSKFFNVLDIIPAYIGNQQDLVVMRKPA